MSLAIDAMLALAVLIDVLCVVGMVAMQDVFGRLHFLGPTAISLLLVTVAVILHEGASQISVKSALILALSLVAGPLVAHAIARAARVRQFDAWVVTEEEREQART